MYCLLQIVFFLIALVWAKSFLITTLSSFKWERSVWFFQNGYKSLILDTTFPRTVPTMWQREKEGLLALQLMLLWNGREGHQASPGIMATRQSRNSKHCAKKTLNQNRQKAHVDPCTVVGGAPERVICYSGKLISHGQHRTCQVLKLICVLKTPKKVC